MKAWCVDAQSTSARLLAGHEADIKRSNARVELARNNVDMMKQELGYLHERRKDMSTLVNDLEHLAHPRTYQEDLESSLRQILSITSPSSSASRLQELIEIVTNAKTQLLAMSRLWQEWSRALQVTLSDIDRRLATTFAHLQSMRQDGVAEAAFLSSMQNFSEEQYSLEQDYHDQLAKVCTTTE